MPQTTVNVQEMDQIRRRRAESESGSWTFRLLRVPARDRRTGRRGELVMVSVTTPGGSYLVNQNGRCNCGDQTRRLSGTAARCKHSHAAAAWLRNGETNAPAPRPRISREQMERDFPSD